MTVLTSPRGERSLGSGEYSSILSNSGSRADRNQQPSGKRHPSADSPWGKGGGVLSREDWLPLARKLDWDYSYVREEEVFPEVISGRPWLPHSEWKDWEESFKTSYREYVDNQYEKDMAVYAVRDA